MLVFLLTKANMVLEKKYCKKNMVRSFCFSYSKIVFLSLTKIVTDYMVIFSINIKKAYLKRIFTSTFYNYNSGFYYYLNNVLYLVIYIIFWKSFEAFKSYYRYI